MNTQQKIEWQGKIISIQPRTNVWRYVTDNRTHYHIGYNLFIDGTADGVNTSFVVAISEKQLQDSSFRIGDVIKGTAWTKMYPEREYADYYRTGALTRIIAAAGNTPVNINLPPWRITPPDLKTYEWRGARMLSLKSWKNECFQCVWANMANVTIEYNWGKTQKHRFESFCYGPKSCKLYKMGRPRAVPYKGRDTCYDDGELDKLCTENRDDDE